MKSEENSSDESFSENETLSPIEKDIGHDN
jgi:hypothetical protein